MTSEAIPFRDVLAYAIGGGWGSEIKDDKNDVAVSIIRGTDFAKMENGQYGEVPSRFESSSKVEKRKLQLGDIVLEVSGGSPTKGQTTGRTYLVTEETLSNLRQPVIPASFCRLVRVDVKKVLPRLAYYWLQDMYSSGRAGMYENQSTGISNFQFERFLDAEALKLPSLEEQHAIAETLGSLDDRINNLRQTSTTLEAIAAALFKSRFMDFDGVPPEDMQESEIGAIPKGWRMGILGDLCELNAAKWTDKKHPPTVRYLDLSSVSANRIRTVNEFAFDAAPSRARMQLREGDTIVGTVRPGNRAFAYIHAPTPNLTGSTGFAVLSPKQPHYASFIYLAATRDEAIQRLANLADGAAYPAVRSNVVAETPCAIAPDEVIAEFSVVTKPMLERIEQNNQQATTLANLRDALLPRLLSGQLRVKQ